MIADNEMPKAVPHSTASLSLDERQTLETEVKAMREAISTPSDTKADKENRLRRYLRTLGADCRRREIRMAPSTADLLSPGFSDDLARYIGAGFNCVVLNDTLTLGPGGFIRMDETDIALRLSRARALNLDVLVYLYADDYPADGGPVLSPAMTPAAITARMAIYDRLNEGEILGVYLLGDDVFLQEVPVETQLDWYWAVRAATNSIPVFGMIGEAGINADEQTREDYYSNLVFDHLIVLMYPYANGGIWTTLDSNDLPVSHEITTDVEDPDFQLREYIDAYVTEMDRLFLSGLKKRQMALFVAQGHWYDTDPLNKRVRPDDVFIQMDYAVTSLRVTEPKQSGTAAIGVFFWGELPGAHSLNEDNEMLEHARRGNFSVKEIAGCSVHRACQMYHHVFSGPSE